MPALATSDGRALTYRIEGSGPTLVCHPGGPGFSSRYFADLAGLDAARTLVLVDPRGTGASDPPFDRRAYDFEDYAADLDELRIHLELEQLDLLGHSHGGCVALVYAASYPGRVGKLVLASTVAHFGPEQHEAMVAGMEAKAGEPWYEDARAALEAEQAGAFSSDLELAQLAMREFPFYFACYGDRETDYLEILRGEIPNADALLYFNNDVFTTFDLRPSLERISAPALVVAGEEDFITGPLCARPLADGIRRSQLVLLPRSGHFVFVEAPDAFRDAILGFLHGRLD
jgi:pimeloyl-ACP methyl ester carboxylesterase